MFISIAINKKKSICNQIHSHLVIRLNSINCFICCLCIDTSIDPRCFSILRIEKHRRSPALANEDWNLKDHIYYCKTEKYC